MMNFMLAFLELGFITNLKYSNAFSLPAMFSEFSAVTSYILHITFCQNICHYGHFNKHVK